MKFRIILFLFATIFSRGLSAKCCCHPENYSFYIKTGSGVSFSESMAVTAPPLAWNPAVQGYHSKLGNSPIANIGIGCEFLHLVDLEISISSRSTFKYRKFQTPLTGGDSYTRQFNLDIIPVLFSINLLGQEIPYLNWEMACGKVYPTIGAGIGVSNLLISNFRTIGLPPSGASDPFPSFSAENQYTYRRTFTYTASVGFEYNYNNCWAITTGYRWFDAGKFKGPRFQRVASGAAVDLNGEEWKMRFRANEWFIEFKILL